MPLQAAQTESLSLSRGSTPLGAAQEGATQAQTPPIVYQRYDATITVHRDGRFTVRHIQQVRFNGRYHTAFVEIPLAYVQDLVAISVRDDQQVYRQFDSGPGSFALVQTDEMLRVNWEYDYTQPGDVRTFLLEYTVEGGLWVYPDKDLLEWRIIPEERGGVPVEASHITVTLPSPVAADQLDYTAFGPSFTTTVADQSVIFASEGSLPDGQPFQVVVGFPHGLVAATVQPWQVAEDQARLVYQMPEVETTLTINADGTLRVEEHQQVVVEAGMLAEGTRRFNLSMMDDITDIAVFAGGQRFESDAPECSYCFKVFRLARTRGWVRHDGQGLVVDQGRAGQVEVAWKFPALVKGESTRFRLAYTVHGAVQVGNESQQIAWTPIFSGREVPVGQAQVRIVLPPGVSPADVTVDGLRPEVDADGALLLTHPGPVPVGQPWLVVVRLPADATTATEPTWQRDHAAALAAYLEAQAAAKLAALQQERMRLGLMAAAPLILVVGLVLVFGLWYLRGRDHPAPLTAPFLREPPSALPPAIVAYLIDEQPSTKGALAALFHLASLGLLRLEFDGPFSLRRIWSGKLSEDQPIQTTAGEVVTVPDHLVILFNALVPVTPVGKVLTFTSISSRFQEVLPLMYHQMGQEASLYFSELPPVTRRRWLGVGQWLVLGGLVALLLFALRFWRDFGVVSIAPPAALMALGGVLMLVSSWMAQKTAQGAEEAERWLAFKQYLLNLKEYGSLSAAQTILDRYFAYAVALDVEQMVLTHSEMLGATLPTWSRTTWKQVDGGSPSEDAVPHPPRRWQWRRPPGPAQATLELPTDHAPTHTQPDLSIQGFSEKLSHSLNHANTDLVSLLNSAVGHPDDNTPFQLVLQGAGKATEISFDAAATTLDIIGEILASSVNMDGSGGYSRGSTGHASQSSSYRSSGFRSSTPRNSGGVGRSGFG